MRPLSARLAALLTGVALTAASCTGSSSPSSGPTTGSLEGTGLTACPASAGIEDVGVADIPDLRAALVDGGSGVDGTGTGVDASADTLDAAVVPPPDAAREAEIVPARTAGGSPLLQQACGRPLLTSSLAVLTCDVSCASPPAGTKTTTWWLKRDGQWQVWAAR